MKVLRHRPPLLTLCTHYRQVFFAV